MLWYVLYRPYIIGTTPYIQLKQTRRLPFYFYYTLISLSRARERESERERDLELEREPTLKLKGC